MSEQSAKAPEPAFNPFSPDFVRNPYPSYHRLRDEEPMHRSLLGPWVASRYEDVDAILRDRRFGKDFARRTKERYGAEALQEPMFASMQHWMLLQDPPDHTRLRGLVAKAFTPRQLQQWRPRIEALVDELLDRLAPRGEMDFLQDFAYPLPINVICDILGIPPGDRDRFAQSSRVSGRVIDPTPLSREELDEANAGMLEQEAYFRDLIARRRQDPGDDLISLLAMVEEAGDRLSEEEMVGNIFLLFGAGHETTVNLLGNGLLALLTHRAQWDRLRAEPELVGNAVEEMLRFDSSVQLTGRVAFEDVEIAGTRIAAREMVICLLGAANRDPAVYPQPDDFQIDRPNIKPTSFGGGIHHCIGAQLARMEAEIAIRALQARLPDLQLATPEQQSWRPTFTLRGLTTLPVVWGAGTEK